MVKALPIINKRNKILCERADQFRTFNLKHKAFVNFQKAIGVGPGEDGFHFYYSTSLGISEN